ncbi:hypothetical protein ACIQH6_19230 [Micromonospora orduensis]|uniref:hypothetical protein n=1 Tax=Micromonospora orduensis TaxID=1420891 RepID=UPI0037F9D3A1
MTGTITLSDQSVLHIDARRHALRLSPGIGGAQIDLGLTVYRQARPPAADLPRSEDWPVMPIHERLRLSATLYVSTRNAQQDRRYLCRVDGEHLVTAILQQGSFQMRGFISDHQLRVIEEQRAGKRIWLILALEALQVVQDEGKPARFAQPTGELSFDVGAGEWADNLEDIEAGTYVELLVPLAGGADYADAVELLRDARGLLREGNVPSAIGQARKALEQVREAYGTQKAFADAVKKTPRQRTLAERWACMVEDLFSTMSGASHKDDVTREFEYTREDGAMLITATAGMLKRLSADHDLL